MESGCQMIGNKKYRLYATTVISLLKIPIEAVGKAPNYQFFCCRNLLIFFVLVFSSLSFSTAKDEIKFKYIIICG